VVRKWREWDDADVVIDTKSHADINPRAITPMGPIPNVESGYEKDLSKLRIGHVSVE
jgi:hypothetical protein